jgi:hypothetical protein
MDRHIDLGLILLASASIGAAATNTLRAQSRTPGAYVIVDINAFNNAEEFKTLIPEDRNGASEEAQFKSAIKYVVNLYDNLFTNNITFTIDVGRGEFDQVTSANARTLSFCGHLWPNRHRLCRQTRVN